MRDPRSLDGEQHFIFFASFILLSLGAQPPRASHGKAITTAHVHTTCLPAAISTVTQHQLLSSMAETSIMN